MSGGGAIPSVARSGCVGTDRRNGCVLAFATVPDSGAAPSQNQIGASGDATAHPASVSAETSDAAASRAIRASVCTRRSTRACVENRDPHHEAFEAEELQRELGPRGERRVAFGLRAAKMRERFMAAIVLAEDERTGAATLEKHHVIGLRERDPARPKRERPIEARGPEEVRGGDATIGEEQIVALALVREERRRRAWREEEGTPRTTTKHQ